MACTHAAAMSILARFRDFERYASTAAALIRLAMIHIMLRRLAEMRGSVTIFL